MRRLALTCAFASLFLASAAQSQQCTSDDTPSTCWGKLIRVKNETATRVAETNTGNPTAVTEASAAALRDFLSLFTAGVDVGTVSTNGTTVTLDWNIPFPFVEDNDRVKLQSVFTDSGLADDVQKALGSNTDPAKSKLTNFDDITTLASYSPVNQHFGRSIAPHTAFLEAITPPETDEEILARVQQLARVIGQLHRDVPGLGAITADTKFSTITDDTRRKQLIDAVVAIATAEAKADSVVNPLVKALTQLINNQPQAYAGATYHYRSELVGPDELSVKGTYEASPRSFNRFLKQNAAPCALQQDGKLADRATCADRLTAYAAGGDVPASDRLSFSIEYKQARGGSVDLSSFGVVAPNTPLTRKQTHSVVYSLTWGRPLPAGRIKDSRVDVAVNYDNLSNDPKKKDRFVATATVTQKISDTMSLPISIVYANHTQYLPQTDKRLGIHFGIAYKVPGNGQ